LHAADPRARRTQVSRLVPGNCILVDNLVQGPLKAAALKAAAGSKIEEIAEPLQGRHNEL